MASGNYPPAQILNYGNATFASCLVSIKPESLEPPVSTLWSNIAAMFFQYPFFKVAHKEPTLADSTILDATVWEIRATRPLHPASRPSSADFLEKQILLVECKRPSLDTQTGWDDATEQLIHYCEESSGGGERVYGAIGIGTKVAFYQYDGALRARNQYPLLNLHTGIIELDDLAGQNAVEHWLYHIRDNGWNYAT